MKKNLENKLYYTREKYCAEELVRFPSSFYIACRCGRLICGMPFWCEYSRHFCQFLIILYAFRIDIWLHMLIFKTTTTLRPSGIFWDVSDADHVVGGHVYFDINSNISFTCFAYFTATLAFIVLPLFIKAYCRFGIRNGRWSPFNFRRTICLFAVKR